MSQLTRLPATGRDWVRKATSLHINDTDSIHTCGSTASASKIGPKQYLLLRVLWERTQRPIDLVAKESLWATSTATAQAARSFLQSGAISIPWKKYLDSIDEAPSDLTKNYYSGLEMFTLVRYHQIQSQGVPEIDVDYVDSKVVFVPERTYNTRQVEKARQLAHEYDPPTPTKSNPGQWEEGISIIEDGDRPSTPTHGNPGTAQEAPETTASDPPYSPPHEEIAKQFKAIEDEQIVNTALILYLNSLLIYCPNIKADWTLHRYPLISKNHQGDKSYEARVDGFLKRQEDGAPLIIVEVKPYYRRKKPVETRMQEGAQMAAWINCFPPKDLKRTRAQKGEKMR
jgi:hypothetical protein